MKVIKSYKQLKSKMSAGIENYLAGEKVDENTDGWWHGSAGKKRAELVKKYLAIIDEDSLSLLAIAAVIASIEPAEIHHQQLLTSGSVNGKSPSIVSAITRFGVSAQKSIRKMTRGKSSRLLGLIARETIVGDDRSFCGYQFGQVKNKSVVTSDVFEQAIIDTKKYEGKNRTEPTTNEAGGGNSSLNHGAFFRNLIIDEIESLANDEKAKLAYKVQKLNDCFDGGNKNNVADLELYDISEKRISSAASGP